MNRKEYYKDVKWKLPENSNWRYFKFHLENDTWKTLSIRNEVQLKKLIERYNPIEIFYSQSLFYNPRRVEHPDYKVAHQLFINNPHIYFDLDSDDLKIAIKDANKLKKLMKGYKLVEQHFTGNKGIRLIYKDDYKPKEKNPLNRMVEVYERRFDLITKILKDNIIPSLDFRMTYDPYRVFRLPNSLHRNGNQCIILKGVFKSPESILKGAMTKGIEAYSRQTLNPDGKGTGPTLPSYYKFIEANIYGCKDLFVPYIVVNHLNRKKIREAQLLYDMPDIYVFKGKDTYNLISLKPVDRRRYEKILRFFKAKNLRTFQYYGHQWIRTTEVRNKNGIVLSNLIFKEVVMSEYGRNEIYSKPHKIFLEAMGAPVTNFNLCGTINKPKIAMRGPT